MAVNPIASQTSQEQWQADFCLAQAARDGDQAAWQQLVDRALPGVYAMLLQLAQGDQELAAEWCQEALTRAWEKLSTWHGDSQFGTWLYRLARNRAIDVLRSKAVSARRSLDHVLEHQVGGHMQPDPAAQPGSRIERQEHQALVQQALQQLPDDLREIMMLREFAEQSYEEMGETLGIPPGTAKSRVFRARQALRDMLAPVMKAEQ